MRDKTWQTYLNQSAKIAIVVPLNDTREHDEKSSTCDCQPTFILYSTGWRVLTHHAFDAREFFEDAEGFDGDGLREVCYTSH